MFYVYIVKLIDDSFYTGYTTDLRERIKKHNDGAVKSTKHKRPVKLGWYCAFKFEGKAIKFEKYLKTAFGKAFRNKHLI